MKENEIGEVQRKALKETGTITVKVGRGFIKPQHTRKDTNVYISVPSVVLQDPARLENKKI